MKCKAVLKEIEELETGGELSAGASAHLPACSSCRAFSDERNVLKQLLASLDTVSTPADFDWRLRARIREERSESVPARRWLGGFAPGARAVTVAASVTLILVAVVVYRQTMPSPASRTPPSASAAAKIRDDVKNEETASTRPQAFAPEVVAAKTAPDSSRSETARTTRGIKNIKAGNTRADGGVQQASQPQRIFSNESASRGAEEFTLTGTGSASGDAGPVISLRVPAPKAGQLRFEDGQGVKRTLAPVSFGGQELIERPEKARLVPASEKGIW